MAEKVPRLPEVQPLDTAPGSPALVNPDTSLMPTPPATGQWQSQGGNLSPRLRSISPVPKPSGHSSAPLCATSDPVDLDSPEDVFIASLSTRPVDSKSRALMNTFAKKQYCSFSKANLGKGACTDDPLEPAPDLMLRSHTSFHQPPPGSRDENTVTRAKWFAATRLAALAKKEEKKAEPPMRFDPFSPLSLTRLAEMAPLGDNDTLSEMSSDALITPSEVAAYHRILQKIMFVDGLHAAVDNPTGNVYWDFQNKRCLPGRLWQDKMPEEVRAYVDRPFTEEETAKIEEAIRLKEVPCQPEAVDPRVIFIIGPSAAGKSTIRSQTENHLQINLSDYVEIDGDEFRKAHQGWQKLLEDKATGYRDASNILLPYTRILKKRFLAYAMENRKNIILPSTGSNLEKLLKEVEMVRSHGYRVDVIGLVVSYREARARALNRAHENGRWNDGTWKKWEAAMHAITHLMDPEISDWCIIFDNQDFTSPSTIYSRAQSLTFVEGVIDAYRVQDKEHERLFPPKGKGKETEKKEKVKEAEKQSADAAKATSTEEGK